MSSERMIWEIEDEKDEIEGLDENGRPDPAYAAALGMLSAPLGRRALALVIDVAVWLVLQLPLWLGTVPLLLKLATGSISPYGLVNHPSFVLAIVTASATVVLTLVVSIVQLVMHGRGGRTIGKGSVGIRSVNVRTLGRPGVGWVLLRYLLMGASGIVPLIGPVLLLASPTFDPERRGRGLHDKATHVWLVDVRKGLNPYDDKRMRVARKLVKAEPAPERSSLPSLATPQDPAVAPQYRPGTRVSAGVIGIARPHTPDSRPEIGVPPIAAPATPAPVEAGKPVMGGYRPAGENAAAPEAAPQAPVAQEARAAAQVPNPQPTPQAARPQQPVAAAPQPVVFGLRLDTGDSIPVAAPVLLGRNPDAAGHPGAHTVALEDESKSLSKTHLLVRPVEGGLEIMDCGSTNGSGLVRGGTEYEVVAGAPVVTIEGDTVRLGDRLAAVIRV
ncbi:RDD family protein [Microbacterium sp.]|uniref:RDD family protein n=1 Tax=Microbacterium sp. TaxID=51671 RepID=UPI002BAE4B29|nr:RDD family protein [Microbacterium sp.]HWK79071.1 RDD family protein [Microbacterium sp.]